MPWLLEGVWGKHQLFNLVSLGELLLDMMEAEPLDIGCLRASLNPLNHLLRVASGQLMHPAAVALGVLPGHQTRT